MSEATTVDELFDELEKDIDFRKIYLHIALEEIGMAIVENKLLQKRIDELEKENAELKKYQIPEGWICHP